MRHHLDRQSGAVGGDSDADGMSFSLTSVLEVAYGSSRFLGVKTAF